ncbi:MAG: hypothetical protein CL797_07755 [Chromatiales bacterium]|jgi:hypothetical protein|nr:hypothetical protein [Chromatiales bacterium]
MARPADLLPDNLSFAGSIYVIFNANLRSGLILSNEIAIKATKKHGLVWLENLLQIVTNCCTTEMIVAYSMH